MIKIICDNDNIIAEVGEKQLAGFRGVVQCSGDKELVELQLATILMELIKAAPELVENALNKAQEAIDNDKS